MGMSLRDAAARAGLFDALRPHLEQARIMARAEGFYTSNGNPWKRAPADGRIPADWWPQLCSVDPAANRATFRLVVFSMVGPGLYDKVESFTDDIRAIGVELESAAVEARFPEAPAPAPRHAGREDADLLDSGVQLVNAVRPAASPSKKEETDFAIKSAAQEFRKNSGLTRDELYERLFGPKDKRALSLKNKNWVTSWTPSRFRRKVWKQARERAELPLFAPKGRRPEK